MTLTSPLDKRGEASDDSYNETLLLLSEGSVHKHFDPYLDIDWDSPEFAVVPNDRRWILPAETDPLGAHPWYQSQSEARQIEIGMWRQANVAKVGLQFESTSSHCPTIRPRRATARTSRSKSATTR